ncbi:MAG: MerR family transcriptional regulator [Cytophagales bacterium]
MPYKPKEIERKYYNIGEVADMFNVATSLIRYWETEFSNIAPKKNSKGNRLYTLKDIENIRLVYNLVKERGYTLQGAKEYLDKIKESPHLKQNNEVFVKLTEIKKKMQELLNSL